MVTKADHERVKTLLKDTITLLCKNGLTFKTKFSIDAVIGVTLDEDDVFLVSMNEIVQSEASLRAKESEAELKNVGSDKETTDHRRRRRKRKRAIKRENQDSGEEEIVSSGTSEYEESNGVAKFDLSPQGEPSAKHPALDPSVSPARDSNGDSKDVVYIKEEMDESWGDLPEDSSSQIHLPDFSSQFPQNMNQTEPNINMPSLSGMNLVPVGSQSWSAPGQPAAANASRMYHPVKPWSSSTVTSDEQQPQEDSSQQGQGGEFICTLCFKSFGNKRCLQEHMITHHGGTGYLCRCDMCGKAVTKSNMARHKRIHLEKNPLQCTFCGSIFTDRSNLVRHQLRNCKSDGSMCSIPNNT